MNGASGPSPVGITASSGYNGKIFRDKTEEFFFYQTAAAAENAGSPGDETTEANHKY